jgi:hypothetical protein
LSAQRTPATALSSIRQFCICFSVASSALRKQISKFIYDEAIKASKAQAIELGEPNGVKELA